MKNHEWQKEPNTSKPTSPDKKKALKAMAALCCKKEQCSADIYAKLVARGLDEKDCVECMEWLTKNQFIDNHRFAIFYARDKFRFNHWGPAKIRMMLIHKEISDQDIREAMVQIEDHDLYNNCMNILLKKQASIKSGAPHEIKNKLIRFGLSKGFNYELINKILERIF